MCKEVIRSQRGFTLVELLVALTIFTMISALVTAHVVSALDEPKRVGIQNDFDHYQTAATLALQSMTDTKDETLLLRAIDRRLNKVAKFSAQGVSELENMYNNPYTMDIQYTSEGTRVVFETRGKSADEIFRLAVVKQDRFVESCTYGFIELDKHFKKVQSDICEGDDYETPPPKEEPPIKEPPKELPPVLEPPVLEPPVEEPPVEEPPVEEPTIPDGYTPIYDGEGLRKLNCSKNYILMNHIDLAGINWIPLCYATPYSGTLDGQGYSIKNLNTSHSDSVGLFAKSNGAVYKGIDMYNARVGGNSQIGALVGQSTKTRFLNIYVESTSNGNFDVGGVVGKLSNNSEMFGVYSESTVNGTYNIGGLVGKTTDSSFIKTGSVSVVNANTYFGGLIGSAQSIDVSRSYSVSNLQGTSYGGGFIGELKFGDVDNSYSRSRVYFSDSPYVGGFIGEGKSVTLKNSYTATELAGSKKTGAVVGHDANVVVTGVYYNSDLVDIDSSGKPGNGNKDTVGKPVTTAEMKRKSTYVGWDFVNIWEIKEGVSYPTLR